MLYRAPGKPIFTPPLSDQTHGRASRADTHDRALRFGVGGDRLPRQAPEPTPAHPVAATRPTTSRIPATAISPPAHVQTPP
jgi:hypothetical protein